VREAAPEEGYRAWHGGISIARQVTGAHLDMAYEYLDWWLSGWTGATMARFERALLERVDSFDEYRVRLPNGTVKHINSSGHPILDEDSEVIEFIATAVDVTERKRAELERRRLASLVEQAGDLMAIADLSGGTPIYLNKAGLKMVGFDSWEEARKRRGIHYIFPEDR
jgi:PAS domain-containing protein